MPHIAPGWAVPRCKNGGLCGNMKCEGEIKKQIVPLFGKNSFCHRLFSYVAFASKIQKG